MEITIKPLSPDLLADYLHFFDHVAFTDHQDWSACYCIHFHWNSCWDHEPERCNRDRVSEYICKGKMHGYLAYTNDGNVVGWCNAGDTDSFAALGENTGICPTGDKSLSVVCFLVAPDQRGNGIASALLERVCTDAAAAGYAYIEGYPLAGEADMYAAHHGTIALFAKYGFAAHAQNEGTCIVRKYLVN